MVYHSTPVKTRWTFTLRHDQLIPPTFSTIPIPLAGGSSRLNKNIAGGSSRFDKYVHSQRQLRIGQTHSRRRLGIGQTHSRRQLRIGQTHSRKQLRIGCVHTYLAAIPDWMSSNFRFTVGFMQAEIRIYIHK
jgi:hypothetical protein